MNLIKHFAQLSLLTLALLLQISFSAQAQTMATSADHAVILDINSGDTLFEKDADTAFPPASMSKLMTVYLAFDAIKHGTVNLSDEVTVSDEAWRLWRGKGSTMFLNARDKVTVEQLLKGIIVLSGNDACFVLAEHMAGSSDTFIEWMNAKAKELGMNGSHFMNPNGWPEENHYMTARDLATLTKHLTTDFPDMYPMFDEREFLYKNFTANRYNRNPMLGRFAGADGLKTGGLPDQKKYGIVGSAIRDGRRVVVVLGGLPSKNARNRESSRLMQYAFRNFNYYPLFRAGEKVDTAEVWLGDVASVPLVVAEDVKLTLSRRQRSQMKVTVEFMNPIPAPLTKGQAVGELIIEIPDKTEMRIPLNAGANASAVGGLGKITAAISYLLFGSSGEIKGN